jgi:hypothetical protein
LSQMNINRIVYYVATGILSLMMAGGAISYFADHANVSQQFLALGFPTFIIYPLAIAKLLGLTAIWTKKSAVLKEWAYAGFFFNLLLASSSHIVAGDGKALPALVGIVFLLLSYRFENK